MLAQPTSELGRFWKPFRHRGYFSGLPLIAAGLLMPRAQGPDEFHHPYLRGGPFRIAETATSPQFQFRASGGFDTVAWALTAAPNSYEWSPVIGGLLFC